MDNEAFDNSALDNSFDGSPHGNEDISHVDNAANRTDGFRGKSNSMPTFGSFDDLKRRTASVSRGSVDGVLKRATYMHHISVHETGPRYKFGARTGSGFIKANSSPAPGSYNLQSEGNKFKTVPRFSFGSGSRFGMGPSPAKLQPGPGAYNAADPTDVSRKPGFGTGQRGRGSLVAQASPGPGAYETKPFGSSGKMFTARGRLPTSYSRSRAQPGPGAYDANHDSVFQSSLKTGFGTSTRDDLAAKARNAAAPGPGTYEMQYFKGTGTDGPKFSATSRRKIQDLSSYLQPGPGAYNAHITQFRHEPETGEY